MLTGVHFLLTYKCTYECDHCFVYSSPHAEGVFTIDQIQKILAQIKAMPQIDTVYFEGGEPFFYYPLLQESLRLAKAQGLKTGIVTNAFWAITPRDAALWLAPLAEIGIDDLSISNDAFHSSDPEHSRALHALTAAKALGIPHGTICIEPPKVEHPEHGQKGQPVVGGDVMFKGRAVDKLTEGLPRRAASSFTECPHEELRDPGRVHVDPFGFAHVCQGIVIGNLYEKDLREVMADFRPEAHPIIGPLLEGGPARLAETLGVDVSMGFVDHCHLCFESRRRNLLLHPDSLAPKQVYGEE